MNISVGDQAGSWADYDGAAAQQYMVTGATSNAATALPFAQVPPCLKQRGRSS